VAYLPAEDNTEDSFWRSHRPRSANGRCRIDVDSPGLGGLNGDVLVRPTSVSVPLRVRPNLDRALSWRRAVVEIRQIEYFLGVLRAGSFGKAADELHVAKSALSRQVKLLETELGAELLIRTPGQELSLTPAGEAFKTEAVEIVAAVDQARASVATIAGAAGGQADVVVGHGWETSPIWMYLMTEFRKAHPGVVLNVSEGQTAAAMLESVRSREVDLAIAAVSEVPEVSGLTIGVLRTERVVVALPPDHRLAGRDSVELDQLREESWLLPPLAREFMAEVGPSVGFEPRIDFGVATVTMARSLVLAGEGVAILNESDHRFYRPAAVVELTPPLLSSAVIAHRSANRNVAVRVARDFLHAQFGALSASGSDQGG
jgi:LysR family transcriptional activator of glutamate synthase operon